MINSETSWLKKLVRYDETGIRQLFEQYYVPLVLFARTYVHDDYIARDMVQDVFYVLVENGEKFATIDNLKVYLYRAVKNKCLKYLRHEEVKDRYGRYLLGYQEEEQIYQESMLEEEVFVLLNQAIQELPAQCKKVFLLTLEGKSNIEIAAALGIGVETVKSHKKAGKKFLYNRLKDAVSCIVLAFLMNLSRS